MVLCRRDLLYFSGCLSCVVLVPHTKSNKFHVHVLFQNVVSPREQLTLCGLQEFPGGASIVWGIELEDNQNDLFPPGERLIRSRSHIFSNAIIPTGDNTFDCEYGLCLEIGRFPEWLARAVLVTICRDLFKYAQKYYDTFMCDDEDEDDGT